MRAMYCIILTDSTIIGTRLESTYKRLLEIWADEYSSAIYLDYDKAIKFVDYVEE